MVPQDAELNTLLRMVCTFSALVQSAQACSDSTDEAEAKYRIQFWMHEICV
jgi:hypothetical protein